MKLRPVGVQASPVDDGKELEEKLALFHRLSLLNGDLLQIPAVQGAHFDVTA